MFLFLKPSICSQAIFLLTYLFVTKISKSLVLNQHVSG